MSQKAVCLLSGGLDSVTSLYVAKREGYRLLALTFAYGQRHTKEIECAQAVARDLEIRHRVVPLEMPRQGSALLDPAIPVPVHRRESEMGADIPVTYVPSRNTIFLAMAASWAEAEGAGAVFIGANALDYSGYPDCRPEYFEAFERLLAVGTKAGVENRGIRICAPLLRLSKKEIVILGSALGVPFDKTWSCYRGGDFICGECDACLLRAKGFREAGIFDPLHSRHEKLSVR